MGIIDNFFHLYETVESFEVHKNQGLINPDSICFIEESGQIYAQGNLYGICKDRYEKLELLVQSLNASINNIKGEEGPSVGNGIVDNIKDIVNFLDGFTDEDNLMDFITDVKLALINQIKELSDSVDNRLNILRMQLQAIDSKVNTAIDRIDNNEKVVDQINNTVNSHIEEYLLHKENYESFKSYIEDRLSAINASIDSINRAMGVMNNSISQIDYRSTSNEKEIAKLQKYMDEVKAALQETTDKFTQTILDINAFKADVDRSLQEMLDTVGEPNGIAPLDSNGKIPSTHLPSYVDDVLEYATKALFPTNGESGKIYTALDTNIIYRWSGSKYTEISSTLALGETSSTAYSGDKGKKVTDDLSEHKQDYSNPHRVTKAQVGLDNVDNTRDIDKPLSTAMIDALDKKVSIEPGKSLVSLEEANKIVETNAKMDGLVDTVNSEINRATEAESAIANLLTVHKNDNTNPHGVTKAQVGLENVDNTSDLDKPVSTAVQEALDNLESTINNKIEDNTLIKSVNNNAFNVDDTGKLDINLLNSWTILPPSLSDDESIRLKNKLGVAINHIRNIGNFKGLGTQILLNIYKGDRDIDEESIHLVTEQALAKHLNEVNEDITETNDVIGNIVDELERILTL